MKTVDTKNKLIINKLIKKHWSLTKKSQKLFTHRLFYERDVPKEFAGILGEDLRYRVDLNNEDLEELDQTWLSFKRRFEYYVDKKNISYSDYLSNRVIVNKNEKKLVKDIVDFYNEVAFEIAENPVDSIVERHRINDIDISIDSIRYYLKDFITEKISDGKIFDQKEIRSVRVKRANYLDTVDNIKLLSYEYDFSDINVHVSLWDKQQMAAINASLIFQGTERVDLTEKLRKIFKKKLEENIRNYFQDIVRSRIFNKDDFQLVISLNFADWFLASTGDSWSSCISLFSTYDECFWTGLAQLIGDKSRAIAYITRKGERKRFRGIEVDKFYARSWVQLYRTISPNKEENKNIYNKTFFIALKSYPVEFNGMSKLLEKHLPVPSYNTILEKLSDQGYYYHKARSRYYAENFWFEKNTSGKETMTTIYLDSGRYKLAKKNKAKYFPGDYGYYKFDGGGGATTIERNPGRTNFHYDTSNFLSNGISFDEIIEDRSSIIEQMDDYINYGRAYEREEEYEDDWDEDDEYDNAV